MRNGFWKFARRLLSWQSGPGVAEIVDALGKERKVARLRAERLRLMIVLAQPELLCSQRHQKIAQLREYRKDGLTARIAIV